MGRRSYSGGAKPLSLTGPVTGSDLLLPVTVPVNWPDGSGGPFSAVISRGMPDEEKVLADIIAGGFMQVLFRGYDGTTAQTHDATALVEHISTGIDHDESNDHVNSSVNVHGTIGGDRLVGELKPATLKGKTMSGADNMFTNIPESAVPQVAQDVADLKGADIILQQHIDDEAAARSVADASEVTARTTADAALTAAVASEASARIATDGTKADAATTYSKAQVDAFIAALTPKIASQLVVSTASVLGLIADAPLVSLPAITFDGSTTVVVTGSVDHVASGQDGGRVMVGIAVDGVYVATKQYRGAWATDNLQLAVEISHTFTPAAGAHTITLRAVRNLGTGAFDFVMGSGGGAPGSNAGPGQLRIAQTR
jgi:predicted thioesterase